MASIFRRMFKVAESNLVPAIRLVVLLCWSVPGRFANIVTKLGADFAQGYLFARPLTSEHLEQWLASATPG